MTSLGCSPQRCTGRLKVKGHGGLQMSIPAHLLRLDLCQNALLLFCVFIEDFFQSGVQDLYSDLAGS